MSSFTLSNDHVGYLVNLGQQLDIRGVTVGDSYQSLALFDEHDRRYVTAELLAANRTSVATFTTNKSTPSPRYPRSEAHGWLSTTSPSSPKHSNGSAATNTSPATTRIGLLRSHTTTPSDSSRSCSRRSSPASQPHGSTTDRHSPDTLTVSSTRQSGRRHHYVHAISTMAECGMTVR